MLVASVTLILLGTAYLILSRYFFSTANWPLYLYWLAMAIVFIATNTSYAAEVCSKAGGYSAGVVFGSIAVALGIMAAMFAFLKIAPAALTPFANTFGYLSIYKRATELINQWIEGSSDTTDPKKKWEMLDFTNKGVVINGLPTGSADIQTELESYYGSSSNTSITTELATLVSEKNKISEGIWYLLTSIFASAASKNIVQSYGCTSSAEDISAKHANLEKKFTQEFEKKKEEVQPRNYYITD
jgi:hypothetical protein